MIKREQYNEKNAFDDICFPFLQKTNNNKPFYYFTSFNLLLYWNYTMKNAFDDTFFFIFTKNK